MQGLEAQLLREVVAQERGELEEAKERLLLSLASDTRQLQDLQDRILKLLKVGHHVLCPDQACGVCQQATAKHVLSNSLSCLC